MGFFFKSASEKAYEMLHDRILSLCQSVARESPVKEPYEIVFAIWTEEMQARNASIYVAPRIASAFVKFAAVLDPFDKIRLLAQLIVALTDEKFRDTKYGLSLDQNLGTLVRLERINPEELNRELQRQSPKGYETLFRELGKKPFYPGSIDAHASLLFPRSLIGNSLGCDAYGRRIQ